MELAARLSEVKSIIRGLLTSSPIDITVNQLNRDFRGEEGKFIPHRDFGFQTLLEFLQSIGDTVLIRDPTAPDPIVKLIQSEKSAHIDSLVQRQNRKPRRGRAKASRGGFNPGFRRPPPNWGPRRGAMSHQGHFVQPPPPSYFQPTSQQRREPIPPLPQSLPMARSRSSHGSQSPTGNIFVPATIQEKIAQFVTERPGISKQELQERIQAKLGMDVNEVYNGMDTLLSSLSQAFRVEDGRVFSIQQEEEDEAGPSHGVRYLPAGYVDEGIDFEKDEEDEYFDDCSDEEEGAVGPAPTHSMSPGRYNRESLMSKPMIQNILLLLKKFPRGLWCSEVPDLYQDEFHVPLDCREVGYISVSQMLSSVPECFRVQQIENSDCRVFDASMPAPQETAISQTVVQQIKQLVASHRGCKGVYIEDFCLRFDEEYQTEFDFKAMGFSTLHSLFEALDGDVIQLVRISNRYRICPLAEPKNDDGPIVAPYSKNDEECYKRFPKNVVGPTKDLPRLVFPTTAVVGSCMEVIVAEIMGPHLFWTQLRGELYHKQLIQMMDDMDVFYASDSNLKKYAMPADTVIVGVHCVTYYLDTPHRCRIINVPSADQVKVRYVDYGTIEIVSRSRLYFLHVQFSTLPMQAFPCSLYNVKPPPGEVKFSREAAKRFLSLVFNKGIMAVISIIDFEALTMALVLVDTTGDEDAYINDILVDEGFAQFAFVTKPEAVEVNKYETLWGHLTSGHTTFFFNPSRTDDGDRETKEQCPILNGGVGVGVGVSGTHPPGRPSGNCRDAVGSSLVGGSVNSNAIGSPSIGGSIDKTGKPMDSSNQSHRPLNVALDNGYVGLLRSREGFTLGQLLRKLRDAGDTSSPISRSSQDAMVYEIFQLTQYSKMVERLEDSSCNRLSDYLPPIFDKNPNHNCFSCYIGLSFPHIAGHLIAGLIFPSKGPVGLSEGAPCNPAITGAQLEQIFKNMSSQSSPVTSGNSHTQDTGDGMEELPLTLAQRMKQKLRDSSVKSHDQPSPVSRGGSHTQDTGGGMEELPLTLAQRMKQKLDNHHQPSTVLRGAFQGLNNNAGSSYQGGDGGAIDQQEGTSLNLAYQTRGLLENLHIKSCGISPTVVLNGPSSGSDRQDGGELPGTFARRMTHSNNNVMESECGLRQPRTATMPHPQNVDVSGGEESPLSPGPVLGSVQVERGGEKTTPEKRLSRHALMIQSLLNAISSTGNGEADKTGSEQCQSSHCRMIQ